MLGTGVPSVGWTHGRPDMTPRGGSQDAARPSPLGPDGRAPTGARTHTNSVSTKDSRVNVRVPLDLVKRLDALIPKAARLPECALLRSMDRSNVARVALLRGVEVLWRETSKGDG